MSKVRVYQLAKEVGISSPQMVKKLKECGIEIKNHMSTLEELQAQEVRELFNDDSQKSNKMKKKTLTKATKSKKIDKEDIKTSDKETLSDKKETSKNKSSDKVKKKTIKTSRKKKDKKDEEENFDFVNLLEDEKEPKILNKNAKKIDLEAIEEEEFAKKERKVKKAKSTKKKTRNHYKQEHQAAQKAQSDSKVIIVGDLISVSEFADKISQPSTQIIMKLMQLGTMASLNDEIDFETAELIALDFGYSIEKDKPIDDVELFKLDYEDDPSTLQKRAPVVTVMGHVDHGKTSLLDAIRSSDVTSGEAGGITQHIGASEVEHNGEKIVFLDTPGHEAFTTLRARGAKVTDIAILVVAADDGVMPQTIEAIDHSKAAGVPIIVAINKMDKAGANPDKVKQELSDHGILIEEWGGDVICVPVSALKREGIDQLLEMVLLVAEMEELKANPHRPAVGTIIEAKLDKGRGALITVLIEKGQIKVGDSVFAGTTYGRVRAMYNHRGNPVSMCGPASAVEIMGMNEVPQSGEKLYVVAEDRLARNIAQRRASKQRQDDLKMNHHVTLEDLFSQIQSGEVKDLNIILKADVHGSVEALRGSLLKLSNDEVKIKIIHANVGTVTESDILLASASNAIIIGFNIRPASAVTALAEREGVELKTYRIIYNAIDDIEKAMKGMLAPEYKEVILGHIEVRDTFKVPNVGVIAGGYVQEGKVMRNAQIRLSRDGIIIHEGQVSSLKRFKNDVKEVLTGYECGIGIENYNDIKEGDIIEAFIVEEIART